jgi:3-hydroxyacyl-[acyl-carrier-protein] dehydratase
MPPPLILDPNKLDLTRVIANVDAIRSVNPQRFEMEALTAIVLLDPRNKMVAGYKDVTHQEFWLRGHMPGMPLMPGVLMCEAAAQLCSYYVKTQHVFDSEFVGLGGLEHVQFRQPVRPGERLVLIGKLTLENKRKSECDIQGFVDGKMVFNAKVLGIPLRRD